MDHSAIGEIRAFNRFFTRTIGVLGEDLLDSGFTLTEARALYELGAGNAGTAREIQERLGIDKGYLSRIVGRFDRAGLIERSQDAADRRARRIQLTPAGQEAFDKLQTITNEQIAELIDPVPKLEREVLLTGMRAVRRVLDHGWRESEEVVIRPFGSGDLGWIVERHGHLYWQEYGWNVEFEALVAEIVARFAREFKPGREGCWIAEVGGLRAGSVMCVEEDPETAKLRLLLVEPFARGRGVGRALVEECIAFAQAAGYRSMILWTNDVLVEARRIYERRGLILESSEPHHSFGHDLVSQIWRLDLDAGGPHQ